ncbi:MAG: hypothetical protein E2O58_08105 [Gammaproteobacteria bacterium]|nr:MAG: hypothetical protein E2O58_08105 [Gammaproteobacteria bacterium]
MKYDGFRLLAYIEDGCKLISRNEFHYQRFKDLAESLVGDLDVSNAILDGEIVCLDDKGHSHFYDLMGKSRRQTLSANQGMTPSYLALTMR